jgi:aryl-alcohol dehydrogenase-like predicted oxidoreductase
VSELRTLGRTGVKVSQLCLGTMMFGAWGNRHQRGPRRPTSTGDAGINFIDTADMYSQGESEEIVRKALAGGHRDEVVLATKFHNQMGGEPNHRVNSGASRAGRSRSHRVVVAGCRAVGSARQRDQEQWT